MAKALKSISIPSGCIIQYSPVVQDKARSLYFEGLDAPAIAKTLRIQSPAILEWMRAGNWESQRRDRIVSSVQQRAEVIIEQEKPLLVERHTRIIQKFDHHVEKALDKKVVKSRDLVNLAKAANSISSMADTTLGLKAKAGIQLYVQFNLHPARVEDVQAHGAGAIFDLPASYASSPSDTQTSGSAGRLLLPEPSLQKPEPAGS